MQSVETNAQPKGFFSKLCNTTMFTPPAELTAEPKSFHSKQYNTMTPLLIDGAKAAFTMINELSKVWLVVDSIAIYFVVGFIVEGVAGIIPAFVLSLVGIPPEVVNAAFFFAWPAVTWMFISHDHAMWSLALVLLLAVHMGRLRKRSNDAVKRLALVEGALAQLTATDLGAARIVESEILVPERV